MGIFSLPLCDWCPPWPSSISFTLFNFLSLSFTQTTDADYLTLDLAAIDVTVFITDNDMPALAISPRVLNIAEGDAVGAVYTVVMQ
eukprot:29506-Prorocentrum_minimum.AAC.2